MAGNAAELKNQNLPFPALPFTRTLKTATKPSWSWRAPEHPLVPPSRKSSKSCADCRRSPMASTGTQNVFGTRNDGWARLLPCSGRARPAAFFCCHPLSWACLACDFSNTLSELSTFWGLIVVLSWCCRCTLGEAAFTRKHQPDRHHILKISSNSSPLWVPAGYS